jgi:hypothetical protein
MLFCLFIILLNRICMRPARDINTNTQIKIINVNMIGERVCRSSFNKRLLCREYCTKYGNRIVAEFFFLFRLLGAGVQLGPLTTAATDWPREFGGMKIGRRNRSTWRNPAPALHCPPEIPLVQTRDRTWAAAVAAY